MNTLKRQLPFWILGAAYLLSALLLFNFYLALSGFIANGFRDGGRMVPLISSYLLPVISFFAWTWDFYVRPFGRVGRHVFSLVCLLWSLVNLVLTFSRFAYYASNHALGAYGGLCGVGFPYDTLVISAAILDFGVLDTVDLFLPGFSFQGRQSPLRRPRAFSLGVAEYLLLCVLGILSLVFTGAFFSGLGSLANVFVDARYLFLLLWILAVPMGNLVLLAAKPHLRAKSRRRGAAILLGGVGGNLLFALGLGLCEGTSPDFMIRVGKPLFMIAFSVSLPIEMLGLLLIMGLSSLVYLARLLLLCKGSKKENTAEVREEIAIK